MAYVILGEIGLPGRNNKGGGKLGNEQIIDRGEPTAYEVFEITVLKS